MTMRRLHFRRFRLSIVLLPVEDLSLQGDTSRSEGKVDQYAHRFWLR